MSVAVLPCKRSGPHAGEDVVYKNGIPFYNIGSDEQRLYLGEEIQEEFGTDLAERGMWMIESGICKRNKHYVEISTSYGRPRLFWTKAGLDLLLGELYVDAAAATRLNHLFHYVQDAIGEKPLHRLMDIDIRNIFPDTLFPRTRGIASPSRSFFRGWWVQPHKKCRREYNLYSSLLLRAHAIIKSGSRQVHALTDPSKIFRIIHYPEYDIEE